MALMRPVKIHLLYLAVASMRHPSHSDKALIRIHNGASTYVVVLCNRIPESAKVAATSIKGSANIVVVVRTKRQRECSPRMNIIWRLPHAHRCFSSGIYTRVQHDAAHGVAAPPPLEREGEGEGWFTPGVAATLVPSLLYMCAMYALIYRSVLFQSALFCLATVLSLSLSWRRLYTYAQRASDGNGTLLVRVGWVCEYGNLDAVC